jgi:Flp pilus assembly protein TadD
MPGKVSSVSTDEDSRPVMVVKQNYKISASVEQQFAYGIEAMTAEDYVQAIEIFNKVAHKEPRASGPWVNIAIAYRKLDQIDKADEAIETAVKLNPKNPYALNQAGIIKREKGAFEEAQNLYKSALAEYPNYSNAHLNLAILCDLYLQKIVCAKSHYQAYQEIEKNDDKQVIAWMSDLSRRESK